jgi:hypothetical protein
MSRYFLIKIISPLFISYSNNANYMGYQNLLEIMYNVLNFKNILWLSHACEFLLVLY